VLARSNRSTAACAVVAGTLVLIAARRLRRSANASGSGARRLGAALRRAPALRRWVLKSLWRLVYGLASRGTDDAGTAFLNYGYAAIGDAGDAGPASNGHADRFGVQLYDRVVRGADLAGKDVLEIGCGRGGGTVFVFETYRPRKMTGLDLSRSAIARCRRAHARPGLTFVQGDAEALPFADASFDVVVNVESSHCYLNVPRFLDEVHRVLRPGGLLLMADVRHTELAIGRDDTLLPHADVAQLRSELDDSGLAVLEEEDITANVVRALQLDSPRRRQAIAERVPRALQQHALIFSAVEGTPQYESLANGDGTYLRFVLQKPGDVRA
jgi:SAM-dependent methyltransferase